LHAFATSLTASSDHTVTAYGIDVRDFATWAERGGVDDPASVDRLLLRRWVAFLTTRRYAKRTIARKVAALRRYFAWALHEGVVATDPTVGLSAPSGANRLPRVLRADELAQLLNDMELSLSAPVQTLLSLMIFLEKPRGGERPIGLTSGLYRLHCKLRKWGTTQWEADKIKWWDTAVKGNGALKCGLRRPLTAEVCSVLDFPQATLL
jgi:hypothetical protein